MVDYPYNRFHHTTEVFNNNRVYHPNMRFNKSRPEYSGNNERFVLLEQERVRVGLEKWARRWP